MTSVAKGNEMKCWEKNASSKHHLPKAEFSNRGPENQHWAKRKSFMESNLEKSTNPQSDIQKDGLLAADTLITRTPFCSLGTL